MKKNTSYAWLTTLYENKMCFKSKVNQTFKIDMFTKV